jgi:hypothetical protein
LKKGDLGGFKNRQTEGIYGKRYKAGSLNKANLQPLLPERSNRVPVKENVPPGTKTRTMAA